MTALIEGPFAEFLDANRGALNHEVAAVSRQASGFDAAAFGEVLRTVVTPVVDAVDRLGAGFTGVVSETLFRVALDLCGQRRFDGAVRHGWEQLLPQLAPQIATDPQRVIASITNALDSLGRAPGARVEQWIELVGAAAPHAPDADALLQAGQVAAWRSGLAAYRGDALALAATLDPALAGAALGLAGDGDGGRDGADRRRDVAATITRLQADPWFDPSAGGRPDGAAGPDGLVAVGSFRGFGGPFLRPPTIVAASAMRALVTDGTDHWFVFADAFGSAVVRTGTVDAPVPTGDTPAATTDPPAPLAGVAEVTSWVQTASGVVATSALSHAVLFAAAP